jgi:hypothetical protein
VTYAAITGFEEIEPIDAGVANYGALNSEAVRSALEVSPVRAKTKYSTLQLVPTDWDDIDEYDESKPGRYTFTADIDIPPYYVNSHGYKAVAEVIVEAPVHAKPPRIIENPAFAGEGFVGGQYTLAVRADSPDGGELQYEWYTGTQAQYESNDGVSVGSDSRELPIRASSPDSAMYWCVVVNNNSAATGERSAERKSAAVAVVMRYAELYVAGGSIEGAPSGGTGADGVAYFAVGETVSIVADAPPEGLHFNRWEQVSGSPVSGLPAEASGTFAMPTSDIAIEAVYGPPPVAYYTLTVRGGTGSGSYVAGEQVRISAGAPTAGLEFAGWTQTLGPSATLPEGTSGLMAMPAGDVEIAASYRPIGTRPYTLTVRGGTGSGSYPAGTQVRIVAGAPPAGQAFAGWEQEEGPETALPGGSSGTVTMPEGDIVIVASYRTQAPQPQGGGGGGGGAAGGEPAAPATVETGGQLVVNDGRVSMEYTQDGGNVSIELPTGKIQDLIANAADGMASVDVSGIDGADAVTFSPKAALDDVAGGGIGIRVTFPEGEVQINATAVKSLVSQAVGQEITVAVADKGEYELTQEQTVALPAGVQAYDISVYSGGAQIHTYGGEIVVKVPYSGRMPAGAWHVPDSGAPEAVPSTYDEIAKAVRFTAPHLSVYAVGYAGWPFKDVAEKDWFYGDVAYVYGNGMMLGTEEDSFGPRLPVTRGMLVTVLGRHAGVDVAGYSGSAFEDVKDTKYYAPYIKWAAEKGIALGVGKGKFEPDARISRQDFAVMLSRYAGIVGEAQGAGATTAKFADAPSISSYAAEAVAWAGTQGIVNGRPDGAFDPKGGATRAEAAAMLHRYAVAAKK